MSPTALARHPTNHDAIQWKEEPFGSVLQKRRAKDYQIQTKDYLPTGSIPVVDQGQSVIAGYTDRADKVLKVGVDGVIVFGDHTCITKYVDFDFAVGADGTQILSAKSGYSAKFLAYALENNPVEPTGYNRHFKFLKERVFSCPELNEQHAIAEALSDADALIASLDTLIAKKRDLKQAVMQQLLTGKTRLPGFKGEWRNAILPELTWFQEGPGVRNYQFTRSGVKLLNGTNISSGQLDLDTTERFISKDEAFGRYSHFLADAGDIVIASSGVTIDRFHEKIATVHEGHLPLCMNTSTIRFKPHAEALNFGYLRAYLASSLFKAQIGGQATGSAQLNFGPSHLSKVELLLPPLEEQSAIASILSDMDDELAVLKARRDKALAIKQGMMQELLTGRIRLV